MNLKFELVESTEPILKSFCPKSTLKDSRVE